MWGPYRESNVLLPECAVLDADLHSSLSIGISVLKNAHRKTRRSLIEMLQLLPLRRSQVVTRLSLNDNSLLELVVCVACFLIFVDVIQIIIHYSFLLVCLAFDMNHRLLIP